MRRTHSKLIAKAESFAAGCSRSRLELSLVDALLQTIKERDAALDKLGEF